MLMTVSYCKGMYFLGKKQGFFGYFLYLCIEIKFV